MSASCFWLPRSRCTQYVGTTTACSNYEASSSTQTYYPFGAVRTTSGTLPTDYTFTGQKLDASASLMYHGARYYDAIGRFAQPDSIIADLYNPQNLNRYSYGLNNPVKYTDPTGHRVDCGDGCDQPDTPTPGQDLPIQTYDDQDPDNDGQTAQDADPNTLIEDVELSIGGLPGCRSGSSLRPDGGCGPGIKPPSRGSGKGTIPSLDPKYIDSFENGLYTGKYVQAGETRTVYRGEGYPYSEFYGTVKPANPYEAEKLYNVIDHGNTLTEVSTYQILPGAFVFEGPVAGGTGWQVVVPQEFRGYIRKLLNFQ